MEDDCNRLSRRKIVAAGLSAAAFPPFGTGNAASTSLSSQTEVKSHRPNILFIFTDDHACQSIGAYGSKINQTPNIDRIAKEGAVFVNSFCANSICGPSRRMNAALSVRMSPMPGI